MGAKAVPIKFALWRHLIACTLLLHRVGSALPPWKTSFYVYVRITGYFAATRVDGLSLRRPSFCRGGARYHATRSYATPRQEAGVSAGVTSVKAEVGFAIKHRKRCHI